MLTDKEIQAVIALDAEKRYIYSLKRIADFAEVWVLGDENGFVEYEDNNGVIYFPIWPLKEYAALCANGEYKDCVPEPIEIHDFIEEYIPDFREQNKKLSLFPLSSGKGVPIELDDFLNDIQIELDQVE